MARICYSCKLQENNYAGIHWKPGAPYASDGPRCRYLISTPITHAFKDELLVGNKLLCSYCRTPNIFRIKSQYEDLPQYRSLAKKLAAAKDEDITDIRVVEDFDPWKFDGTTCVTVRFNVNGRIFIFDFQAAGEKGYAMFKYAHDSASARKDVLQFIRWWVNAATTRNWE